jgi:hypothetical protein
MSTEIERLENATSYNDDHARYIAESLGGAVLDTDGYYKCLCPCHSDTKPSMRVGLARDGNIDIHCRSTCKSSDIWAAIRRDGIWTNKMVQIRYGNNNKEHKPAERNYGFKPIPIADEDYKEYYTKLKKTGVMREYLVPNAEDKLEKKRISSKLVDAYVFRYPDGLIQFVVLRYETEDYTPRQKATVPRIRGVKDGETVPTWLPRGWPGEGRVIYNLPEVLAQSDKTILMVEGEKTQRAAVRLISEGKIDGSLYVPSTWHGGTGATAWTDWTFAKDRDIVFWPDNDDVGAAVMRKAAKTALEHGARSVSIIPRDPAFASKWDIADEAPEDFDYNGRIKSAVEHTADDFKDDQDGKPSDKTVNGKYHVFDTPEQITNFFNKKFIYILNPYNKGRNAYRLHYLKTKEGGTELDMYDLSLNDLKTHMPGYVILNEKEKFVPALPLWFSSFKRREYKSFVFDPDKNHGEIKVQDVENNEEIAYFNTWVGFNCAPRDGKWDKLRHHIENNICSGIPELYEYLYDWAAHIFKYPAVKTPITVVLQGESGVGKSIFGKVLRHMIGRQHTAEVGNFNEISGNFNEVLENRLLVQIEECGVFSHKDSDTMKHLTGSDTIQINAKGQSTRSVPNYLRFLLTSNADTPVRISGDDRRYFMLTVGKGNKQEEKFFSELIAELNDGGYEGFMQFLVNREVGRNLRAIPDTDLRMSTKEVSIESTWAFIYHMIENNGLSTSAETVFGADGKRNLMTKSWLYEKYTEWVKTQPQKTIRHEGERAFNGLMARFSSEYGSITRSSKKVGNKLVTAWSFGEREDVLKDLNKHCGMSKNHMYDAIFENPKLVDTPKGQRLEGNKTGDDDVPF